MDKQIFDFNYFENRVRDGHGQDAEIFLNERFPHGSSVSVAVEAVIRGGGRCEARTNPDGTKYHSCRKFLTPPRGKAFLGSVEWDLTFFENPPGIIDRIVVTRSQSLS